MSSKPKAADYAPSEAEKVSAAAAKADKDYFDQKYSPLLREMRDIADRENYQNYLKGTASANTMQALTGKPSLAATRSVDAYADLASASMAEQQRAGAVGLEAKRTRQLGVLGTARGQQADTTTGLANAAKLANTTTLQQAQRRQMMREARQQAGFRIGSQLYETGRQNFKDTGNIFTPKGGRPKIGDALSQAYDNFMGNFG